MNTLIRLVLVGFATFAILQIVQVGFALQLAIGGYGVFMYGLGWWLGNDESH